MDEIFKKLPELIQTLLSRIEQTGISQENEDMAKARQKLISQLKMIVQEMSDLSGQKGEKLSEEQIKQILEIPRPASSFVPWLSVAKK